MGNRIQALGLYNAGYKATQDRSYADWGTHAYGMFQSACLTDPTFGQAWAANGNNNGDLNRLNAAIACFRRALRGDLDTDGQIKVMSNLSWRLFQVGEFEESLAVAQKAVELGPTYPYPWVNLSVAHGAFGERVAALKAAYKESLRGRARGPFEFCSILPSRCCSTASLRKG